MKRLCISRLPKVLVIQLKRFDYDWERSVTCTVHTCIQCTYGMYGMAFYYAVSVCTCSVMVISRHSLLSAYTLCVVTIVL